MSVLLEYYGLAARNSFSFYREQLFREKVYLCIIKDFFNESMKL